MDTSRVSYISSFLSKNKAGDIIYLSTLKDEKTKTNNDSIVRELDVWYIHPSVFKCSIVSCTSWVFALRYKLSSYSSCSTKQLRMHEHQPPPPRNCDQIRDQAERDASRRAFRLFWFSSGHETLEMTGVTLALWQLKQRIHDRQEVLWRWAPQREEVGGDGGVNKQLDTLILETGCLLPVNGSLF